MSFLEIQDLHVSHGAVQAIRGVNLSVNLGETVTLIGANGAGKTTILRTISGLLKPHQGKILLEGREITGLPPHEIVKRGVVHVPEGRGIFGNLTVIENLELGAYLRHDHAQLKEDRARVLGLFPRLRERLTQMAGTLSGGEQQMLAIGRALLARPRLLLLDEPSLGLAPQVITTIFQVISEIHAQGTTILLVEQNAHLALQTAQTAYVLETGEIKLHGPAQDLAQSPAVRAAYLGMGA